MGGSNSKDKKINGEKKENEDYDDFRDWLNVTPSFCGGYMGVGARLVDSYKINALDDGTTLSYRVTNRLPLPRDKVWQSFDNFLEFVKLFNPTAKHESGSANNVGEIISFNLDFSKYGIKTDVNTMKQQLTIKDDKNFVWQMSIPASKDNDCVLFERYNYTVRIYEDAIIPPSAYGLSTAGAEAASSPNENENKKKKEENKDENDNSKNGSLLVTDTEFVFNKNLSKEARKYLLKSLRETCHEYSKQIYDISFDKCGIHFNGNMNVKVPIEWLFNFLKDWNELGWVLAAKQDSNKIYDKDVRSFESVRGQIVLERASVCDNDNYIFEYQVLNGDQLMPLRDTIRLTKIGDCETNFKSKISIFPRPNQNSEQLKQVYQFVINSAETKLGGILLDYYQKSLKK